MPSKADVIGQTLINMHYYILLGGLGTNIDATTNVVLCKGILTFIICIRKSTTHEILVRTAAHIVKKTKVQRMLDFLEISITIPFVGRRHYYFQRKNTVIQEMNYLRNRRKREEGLCAWKIGNLIRGSNDELSNNERTSLAAACKLNLTSAKAWRLTCEKEWRENYATVS